MTSPKNDMSMLAKGISVVSQMVAASFLDKDFGDGLPVNADLWHLDCR